jgi:hypothetical protein
VTAPVKTPPKPTYDPDVHLKPSGTRKPPRTLKGDLKNLKGKISSSHSKWVDARKSAEGKKQNIRREAGEILAPVKQKVGSEKEIAAEVVKPVLKAVAAVRVGLSPGKGKTRPYVTSFMISVAASWAIGPQFLLAAAYERIRYGTSTIDWGLLQGPGRWFRDTLQMASETGQTVGLIAAICLGLAPMVLFSFRSAVVEHIKRSPYYGKAAELAVKWLTRLPWMVPAAFLVGVAYPDYITAWFGQPWTLGWWQIWVAGLFCAAYYCTLWVFDRMEKLYLARQTMSGEELERSSKMGPGLFHAVLMIPLASIISGALLNAQGAAW